MQIDIKRIRLPTTDPRPIQAVPQSAPEKDGDIPGPAWRRPGTVLVAYSGMKLKKNPEFTTLPRNMIALANPLASSHATAHAGHGLL
ncbi:hypothetical protein [Rivihabitans pingtungensis]|jgi:hypothetical protein|uniref:hypothetical protein n=1 Tax=Rivihabitans pingtungensis TaxID=1054498 RepID=UPI0011B62AFB|nr:hypothetical protein [Rivihabitans pingtungensis]MCK6435860.1 hypothetical protein [Rivihabitans pingtungensis]